MEERATYQPQRLVVDELLVRVTADSSVEDGQKTGDLGINLRRIADAILIRHIMPHMPQIIAAYQGTFPAVKQQKMARPQSLTFAKNRSKSPTCVPARAISWPLIRGTVLTCSYIGPVVMRDILDQFFQFGL